MKFSFTSDKDTVYMLGLVQWCLVQYFGLNNKTAIKCIEKFNELVKEHWDESFYHQDPPYLMATKIYFRTCLLNQPKSFDAWLKTSPYNSIPEESMVEYRKYLRGEIIP